MAHTSAVVGNTAQLNQVLMNLLDNAMRAAGEDGHVWVGTTEADGAVTLQVRDNGKGIAAAVVDRIFDPLFSTHDSPDATGLGLHITKRIVEQHGGTISAKSHCETGGAEFTVVFPIQPEGTAESWN